MRIDNSQAASKIPGAAKVTSRKNETTSWSTKAGSPSPAEDGNQLASETTHNNDEDRFIKKSNSVLENRYIRLEFNIHEETEEIMVKVIDRDTNEVIREIPPEKILDMIAKFWELAGLFIDEKR